MKLALIGYGKMGKMLEKLAPEYGFEVAVILDVADNVNGAGITRERFAGVDAAIEFSTPEAAVANATALAGIGVPVVIGTTGWLGEMEKVKSAVEAGGSARVLPGWAVGGFAFGRTDGGALRPDHGPG